MECPKCGFALDTDFTDCPHCGIVVSKFLRGEHSISTRATTGDAAAARANADAERREAIARGVALPAALVGARIAVHASPGLVRLVTMWVHESGHTVAAWLCGYSALPTAWVTAVAPEQSRMLTLVLVVVLTAGGYTAWRLRRWFWVAAFAGTLPVLLYCTFMIGHVYARQFITFGGDAGCLVLGTLLMLTIYARADHPIRENQIRWGLLVIGALAFMDVYTVWSGPFDHLPFGEDENGISDPSVLTEMDGWNVLTLVHRYLTLARACFAILAIVYVAQLYAALHRTNKHT